MKTKLLFTAALMAATVGTQAVPSTGSSMLVQLLENQRLEKALLDEVSTEASADEPIDYTDKVRNPFDLGEGARPSEWHVSAWYSGDWKNNFQVKITKEQRGELPADKDVHFYERYYDGGGLSVGDGFFTAIMGLPDGNYQVKYAAFVSSNNPNVVAFAETSDGVANESDPIPANVTTLKYFTMSGVVKDGVLRFGLRCKEGNTAGWIGLTDISLSYVDGARGILNNSIRNANTVKKKLDLTEGGLVDAITAAQIVAKKEDATVAECKEQCEALENVVNGVISANASEQEPYDMTYAVKNADCSKDYVGWEKNAANASAGYTVNSVDINSGVYTGVGVEYYVGPATPTQNANLIWQTLTGMPEGKYRVTAYAMGRNQTNGANTNEGGLNLFANDATTTVTSTEWGKFSVECLVLGDGNLTLGLSAGTDNKNNWVAISNVRLEYLGVDLSALQESFAALQEETSQYLAENPQLPQGCINALNEYVTMPTEGFTANEYDEAITALTKLLADAPSLVAPYAAYSTLKTNVSTFNDETVASEDAEQVMANALSTADVAVEAAASVEELNAAVETLWSAVRTYAATVTDLAEGVEQTDVTFLAQNMDFASNDVAPWTKTVDNSGGNFRMMAPDAANLRYDGRFLESYVNTSKVAANANLKLVYQTLTGMPVGSYTFQARAFNRDAWFKDGRTLNPLLLYVNNGETEADSRTLETVFTVNGASGDGVVEFGLKSPADFNSDWNGIADAHLYYTGAAEDLALSENDTAYEVAGTVANVTLTRILKSDAWNTFCVPFDMTAEQLAANGITDVRALETASVEGTSVTLNFSESSLTAVEAGVPYLVKVTDFDGTINVENAVMAAAPGAVTVNGVTMTGNYAADTVPVGAYFISNNAFYYADEASNVALKGFRAYINVNGTSEAAGANRLMINLDGEVTGIEDVLGEEAAEADKLVNVVSLDGMTVKAGVKKSEALDGLQKGIYIVDGKKYVVK